MSRAGWVAFVALVAVGVPAAGGADPPPEGMESSDPRWSSDWTYCEGTAPLDAGCTFETRFRGFMPPGHELRALLYSQCGDRVPPFTYVHRGFEFNGSIEVTIRGESGEWLRSTVDCGKPPDIFCVMCASLDGDPKWSKWERLTVTTEVEGVGPWAIGVGIPFSTVPDQPRRLRWRAVSRGTVDLMFERPLPYGATITGYAATCESRSDMKRTVQDRRELRARIGGLEPNVPYTCKVAARSDRGLGWWSEPVKVKL